jgi:hypothetical protein
VRLTNAQGGPRRGLVAHRRRDAAVGTGHPLSGPAARATRWSRGGAGRDAAGQASRPGLKHQRAAWKAVERVVAMPEM